MKQLIFIAIAVIALSSCKKDVVCNCSSSSGGSYVRTVKETSKRQAKKGPCANYTDVVQTMGPNGGTTTQVTNTCSIQ